MSSAHHDQRWRRSEAFNEDLCPVGEAECLVAADVRHSFRDLDGLGVQFRGPQRTGDRAIGPQQQFRAQSRAAFFGVNNRGQAYRLAAVVGFYDLRTDGQEVVWFTQRLQIEIHGAAADKAVTGGDVFVQIIVFEFRSPVQAQNLFRRKPDVALNAAAAQRANSGAVLPDKQHRAGFLRRGTLRPHHGGQNTGLTLFQVVNRSLYNFSHLNPH